MAEAERGARRRGAERELEVPRARRQYRSVEIGDRLGLGFVRQEAVRMDEVGDLSAGGVDVTTVKAVSEDKRLVRPDVGVMGECRAERPWYSSVATAWRNS